MALLSDRQQTAHNLMRSIQAMKGAYVVNPMPLAPGAHLLVHVEHPHDQHVRGVIEGWGWGVVDRGNTSRFNVSDGTMRLTSILEVQIDTERQQVPADERAIPRGELASAAPRAKSEAQKAVDEWYGIKS